jgi:hypothetical protein
MTTTGSEQTAWALYGELSGPDRHLVEAWRALGNDWVTSVLNSGVLRRGGRRMHPNDAAVDDWWSRRDAQSSPAGMRHRAAEHEAAHVIVAEALGVHVHDVRLFEDGSGETTHEGTSPDNNAAIAAAGYVWVEQLRFREFPDPRDIECREDRRKIAGLVDAFGARQAATKARNILREHSSEVLRLAGWLERTDSLELPLREQLVQAEIRQIMGRS